MVDRTVSLSEVVFITLIAEICAAANPDTPTVAVMYVPLREIAEIYLDLLKRTGCKLPEFRRNTAGEPIDLKRAIDKLMSMGFLRQIKNEYGFRVRPSVCEYITDVRSDLCKDDSMAIRHAAYTAVQARSMGVGVANLHTVVREGPHFHSRMRV